MEKVCVFCGESLGMLQGKKMHCGSTSQLMCSNCYEKELERRENGGQSFQEYVLDLSERLLATGRAENSEKIREYAENVRQGLQEEEERKQKERKERETDLTCLRCGGKMQYHGHLQFKLGEEHFLLGEWNHLLSDSVTMKVIRCEQCGKAEFYIP